MNSTAPTPIDVAAAVRRLELSIANLTTYARLLQDAVVRYGDHADECAFWVSVGDACDCGYRDLMAQLLPRADVTP